MADTSQDFSTWLCERLKNLNLDEEVLGEYIGGILDSDDSNDEEKLDTLKEILEGMMDTPDEKVSSGIFLKWKEFEDNKNKKKKEQEISKQDILAAVMEKQSLTTKVEKESSQNIDVDIKKQVIAQYGHQEDDDGISSDSEEDLPVNHTNKTKTLQKGLFQNTNVSSVVEKEKEKRDRQKLDNDEKKQRIKQDREKQKEKVEQRKDKEKKRTQKGERRR